MERVQGARTPYEVYCHHCRVTFPREARRCIHCGGRLGPPGPPEGYGTTASAQGAASSSAPVATPADEAGMDEEFESGGLLRRFGGLAVWGMLALAAVLSRMCEQGG